MGLGYLNRDDSASNPDWWDNHHVLIPYCTGDLHSGTVTTPTEDTFDLYFAGHLVLAAVLDELVALHGLSSASDIIVSGDSAGGIGVWMNVDYVAERFPNARVTAAPFAGTYYFYYLESHYVVVECVLILLLIIFRVLFLRESSIPRT